ncbi:MAG TPA: hypothetical protein VGQ36_08900 [Thermoanaerobaculia bacterium]|jgi:hypothetical protein|nr:hypothetical protein [Thermoanaerobaculia bacterium]
MNAERCSREDELLDALTRGFVGAELGAHAATCASCGELRLVAGALLEDRSEAMANAAVPSAGTMWWRMQLRQRQEAQALARRSLLVGQAVTLVVATALVVTLFGTDIAVGVREAIAAVRLSTPLLLAIATSVFVVPIGLGVILSRADGEGPSA